MQIPVDLLHWLLAFLPIVVLALLLVQLRWTAEQAGAAGIFAGISGQEGAILRKTLPWTLAAFLLTGAATVLLVWFAS